MHLSNGKTDQAASQDDSLMKYKQHQTEVVEKLAEGDRFMV
jgi:hypothetical protein